MWIPTSDIINTNKYTLNNIHKIKSTTPTLRVSLTEIGKQYHHVKSIHDILSQSFILCVLLTHQIQYKSMVLLIPDSIQLRPFISHHQHVRTNKFSRFAKFTCLWLNQKNGSTQHGLTKLISRWEKFSWLKVLLV